MQPNSQTPFSVDQLPSKKAGAPYDPGTFGRNRIIVIGLVVLVLIVVISGFSAIISKSGRAEKLGATAATYHELARVADLVLASDQAGQILLNSASNVKLSALSAENSLAALAGNDFGDDMLESRQNEAFDTAIAEAEREDAVAPVATEQFETLLNLVESELADSVKLVENTQEAAILLELSQSNRILLGSF